MSLHRKWIFSLLALVCIVFAVAGGLMYPSTPWGIIAPVLYVIVMILFTLGILRLIYLKGLPS